MATVVSGRGRDASARTADRRGDRAGRASCDAATPPTGRVRFVSVNLHEPPKSRCSPSTRSTPFEREAFIVLLLDNEQGKTYEAVVSLTRAGRHWLGHAERRSRPSPSTSSSSANRAARPTQTGRRRCASAASPTSTLCMVEPWSAGNYGIDSRQQAADHARAHLGARQPARQRLRPAGRERHHGGRPARDGGARASTTTAWCRCRPRRPTTPATPPVRETDLQADRDQPARGTELRVDGHEVRWQKWRFRVGFTLREGLVLHTVSYQRQGPRAADARTARRLSEMVVPYGDPAGSTSAATPSTSARTASACSPIRSSWAATASARSATSTRWQRRPGPTGHARNAICIHEEDYGVLWKHTDWRANYTEVRRSRRLVGLVHRHRRQLRLRLLLVLLPGRHAPVRGEADGRHLKRREPARASRPYGVDGRAAALRADPPALLQRPTGHDGRRAAQRGVRGQHGQPIRAGPKSAWQCLPRRGTLLATESQAQRAIDPLSARFWTVANRGSNNRLGDPVGYKLLPGENVLPFAARRERDQARGVYHEHLWVTPYRPRERYAAGDYPNQHPGGDGCRATPPRTADRRYRHGGLVHLRCPPHRAARGLAGDARLAYRLLAEAGRLLRSQSRSRRPAFRRRARRRVPYLI